MSKALIAGPHNKSVYTQEFEVFTKTLLYSPEQAIFQIADITPKQKALIVTLDNKEYNISEIMHKTNYSHLNFDQNDSKYYTSFLHSEALHLPSSAYDVHSFFFPETFSLPSSHNNSLYQELSYGEKCAINIYTGSFHKPLNGFLHDDLSYLEAYKCHPKEFQALAKEIVLHTAMMASGLNKIESSSTTTYRREHAATDEDFLNRDHVIQEDKAFTEEAAFMSTSTGKYFMDYSDICFTNHTGKNISGLSMFPDEEEHLILPSQVQWLSKEEIEAQPENVENNRTCYYAQNVNSLLDFSEPIVSEQHIRQLKDLVVYHAEEHGINSEDVLTDFNQTLLEKYFSVEPAQTVSFPIESSDIPPPFLESHVIPELVFDTF